MNSSNRHLIDQEDAIALETLIREVVQEELQRLGAKHLDALPTLREAREPVYRIERSFDQTLVAGGGNREMTIEYGHTESQAQVLGRWIVADPAICHGKPTFRNTRIMVWQVLEMVAFGMAWETIVDQWDGKVTKDAIAEAVNLANRSFALHAHEHALEMVPA